MMYSNSFFIVFLFSFLKTGKGPAPSLLSPPRYISNRLSSSALKTSVRQFQIFSIDPKPKLYAAHPKISVFFYKNAFRAQITISVKTNYPQINNIDFYKGTVE